MFYKTDYNSPVGNITLGADGEHIVGLWIKGQKYFADTVKEKMFQMMIYRCFRRRRTGWTGIFAAKTGNFRTAAGSEGRGVQADGLEDSL